MFKNFLKVLLTSTLVTSSVCLSAPASNLKCTPLKVKTINQNLILEVSPSSVGQIYFIKNHSSKSLWLDKVNKRPSASAGWASYLRPGNWSALFLNKKEFTMNCAVIKPGKVDYVNCATDLTVCTPSPNIEIKNSKNSFWVVEDKPWDAFIASVDKHKIK